MTIEELKALHAKIPGGKLVQDRKNQFFRIEENKPVTFFVLLNEHGYSTRGIWCHPIATHFIGKRIGCTNVDSLSDNTCYVCEQIALLEENLQDLKQEADAALKDELPEGEILLVQAQNMEKTIQQIRSQQKWALNILVKGEEVPRILEAPKSVMDVLANTFESALKEDGINIFDPTQCTAFTVTKTGKSLNTKYAVVASPRPTSLVSGADRDERIARILKAGVNLDERYKLPTRTEQITVWDAYVNPQPASGQSVSQLTHTKPAAPRTLSHLGGKVTDSKATSEEHEVDPEEADSEPDEASDESTTVAAKSTPAPTSKSHVPNALLARLKQAGAAKA